MSRELLYINICAVHNMLHYVLSVKLTVGVKQMSIFIFLNLQLSYSRILTLLNASHLNFGLFNAGWSPVFDVALIYF